MTKKARVPWTEYQQVGDGIEKMLLRRQEAARRYAKMTERETAEEKEKQKPWYTVDMDAKNETQ